MENINHISSKTCSYGFPLFNPKEYINDEEAIILYGSKLRMWSRHSGLDYEDLLSSEPVAKLVRGYYYIYFYPHAQMGNPEAMKEYFAKYRKLLSAAKKSGYRKFILSIPASLQSGVSYSDVFYPFLTGREELKFGSPGKECKVNVVGTYIITTAFDKPAFKRFIGSAKIKVPYDRLLIRMGGNTGDGYLFGDNPRVTVYANKVYRQHVSVAKMSIGDDLYIRVNVLQDIHPDYIKTKVLSDPFPEKYWPGA